MLCFKTWIELDLKKSKFDNMPGWDFVFKTLKTGMLSVFQNI